MSSGALRWHRLLAWVALFLGHGLFADEGMWLFGEPPISLLQRRYGFEFSPAWLKHVQRSTVRFSNGGSGAFVSAGGLIATNHHIALAALQRLSTPENDYVHMGYLANCVEEERRCEDLELDILVSEEDVTRSILAASKTDASPAEVAAARRAARHAIEKDAAAQSGLRCEVLSFFQGSRYRLLRYKHYKDVRLVFAPEQRIAFFGGDADNFEYPRYALDFCLLRAYEDGKPANVADFLSWSKNGTVAGDLVFVAGQPGRTNRFLTHADLASERRERMPMLFEWAQCMEAALRTFSAQGAEQRRRSQALLFSFQNTRKRYRAEQNAITDDLLIRRGMEDAALKRFVESDERWKGTRDAWERLGKAQRDMAPFNSQNLILGRLAERSSTLLSLGRGLYRHAFEKEKPDGERLYAFRELNQANLKQTLLSEKPLFEDVETVCLATYLKFAADRLGLEKPETVALLNGKAPEARARELVSGTQLMNLSTRKRLWSCTREEMIAEAQRDPLLTLIAVIDQTVRRAQQAAEAEAEIKGEIYAKIGAARQALGAGEAYPDANSTLRFGFGVVDGYEDRGMAVPPFTTLGEMYEQAAKAPSNPDYVMPDRWIERKNDVDFSVPLNFASTCDVIGGSSGSPVFNKESEIVGIIFDGNRDCAGGEFAYSGDRARAISVDLRGALELLRKVYRAGRIVEELMNREGRWTEPNHVDSPNKTAVP